jgi:hypothetical protein
MFSSRRVIPVSSRKILPRSTGYFLKSIRNLNLKGQTRFNILKREIKRSKMNKFWKNVALIIRGRRILRQGEFRD